MKASVIIPVFNERRTIEPLIHCVVATTLPAGLSKEIVVVDDGSTDGTSALLEEMADRFSLRIFRHDRNLGKGAALRSGLALATGDFVIFQDADLEYNPHDYELLVAPLLSGRADIVYGSRFRSRGSSRTVPVVSRMLNTALTAFSNFFTKLSITDMETGYKAFRRTVFEAISIQEEGFGVEPELTAKVGGLVGARLARLTEVDVSYRPRTRQEGKKIRFRDGLWALVCIVRYRGGLGGRVAANLADGMSSSGARRWMAD